MNSIQNHIDEELKNSAQYELTPNDQLYLEKNGLEEFFMWKLMSKKFRKWKLSEECSDRTKNAVHLSVKNNASLELVFFMGGYKLWRLPSSPEVDWAEFFNISYLLKYIAPLAKVYKEKVILYYFMHTFLMEKHDNLTTKEINQYVESFQKLLDAFKPYLPKNVEIKIWKDADLYERKEYFEVLESGFKKAQIDFQKLPSEKQEYYKKLARLNIKWKGKENWEALSDKEKEEKIKTGAYYEIAATNMLTKVNETVKTADKILLFTKSTPSMIGVGSTKTSIAKFWVGFGVLEKNRDTYQDRVLTPNQFETAKLMPHEIIKTDIIPLKNLREIWLYESQFDFTKRT